jgi:hypothetical protein
MSAELAKLRAQHEALGKRIAEMENREASPKPSGGRPVEKREPGVYLLNEEHHADDLPDLATARKLLAIVRGSVPGAEKMHAADPDRLLRNFCAALRYVANRGVSPVVNNKYSIDWWVSDMQQALRARGAVAHDVGGIAFTAACLANDVAYVRADPARGFLWEFALMPYGGTPNPSGWRRVLERGAPRSASAPLRPASREPVHYTVRL